MVLFIEMGEAKWESGKPRAFFVYSKFKMALRYPCGDTEQVVDCGT